MAPPRTIQPNSFGCPKMTDRLDIGSQAHVPKLLWPDGTHLDWRHGLAPKDGIFGMRVTLLDELPNRDNGVETAERKGV